MTSPSTQKMPTRHHRRISLAARDQRRRANPGACLLPGESPQHRYINAKVHDVDTGESQAIYFDYRHCSQDCRFVEETNTFFQRIIDLTE